MSLIFFFNLKADEFKNLDNCKSLAPGYSVKQPFHPQV